MKMGCTSLCKHVLWVSKFNEYVLFYFQKIKLSWKVDSKVFQIIAAGGEKCLYQAFSNGIWASRHLILTSYRISPKGKLKSGSVASQET